MDSVSICLYDLVTVQSTPHDPDVFVGNAVPGRYGRIFGGQLLGQSVMAASATVDPQRVAHSLHANFVQAGNPAVPVQYRVERIRDGRSFSLRAVRAWQGDRLLMTETMSFHEAGKGLDHSRSHDDRYPAPEDLETYAGGAQRAYTSVENLAHRAYIELRPVVARGLQYANGDYGQAVWLRAKESRRDLLATHAAVHRAVLALASDFTLLEPVVHQHDLSLSTPDVAIASLDHSLWWHTDGGLDDWILYVQESPWAGRGRGFACGRLFDRDGRLLASVAQEGLVRVPDEG